MSQGRLVADHFYYCINWRNGSLAPLRTETSSARLFEMQFISHNTVVIAHLSGKCWLELCTITHCPERCVVIKTLLLLQPPAFGPKTFISSGNMMMNDSGDTGSTVHPVKQLPLLSTSVSTSMCLVEFTYVQFDEETLFRLRSHVLVMRCAFLLKLAESVAHPDSVFTWPRPRGTHLSLNPAPLEPANTQDVLHIDMTQCTAPTMTIETWSEDGALWLDCGDLRHTQGRYRWAISGERLICWTESPDRATPTRPLYIFHFNPYDVRRASASIQSEGGTTSENQGIGREIVHGSEGNDHPFCIPCGPWSKLPKGREINVVDQLLVVPAGDCWGEDIVSNLPFAITRTTRAESWPTFTIHQESILREPEKPTDGVKPNSSGTCFEVFRIGNDWTSASR